MFIVEAHTDHSYVARSHSRTVQQIPHPAFLPHKYDQARTRMVLIGSLYFLYSVNTCSGPAKYLVRYKADREDTRIEEIVIG